MRAARWIVLLCVTAVLAGLVTATQVAQAPVAAAGAWSADPPPTHCPPPGAPATGTWCLPADNLSGGDGEDLGVYEVHLNSHTDTSLAINIPHGGLAYNEAGLHNTVMGGDLRDTTTNNRVDTGRRVLVDWANCATGDHTCTWTFLKGNYPKPPPANPAFPAPSPVWLFWSYPYRSDNLCCWIGNGGFAIKVIYDEGGDLSGPAPPTAAFTSTPVPVPAGTFTFSSTSTDPAGSALAQDWTFGDGASGIGAFTQHEYKKPGTYPVTLKVTNQSGLSATKTQNVVVTAPTLSVQLSLLDGAAPPLDPNAKVRVKTTVAASAAGVGALSGITFAKAPVSIAPTGMLDVVAGPNPTPDPGGFSLDPGQKTEFVTQLKPAQFGRYTLVSAVSGHDAAGQAVTADTSAKGVIGRALEVAITLDPSHIKQKEDATTGPAPVDVAVTVKLTNTTGAQMTDVNLQSLRVDRTKPGQLLDIVQKDGVKPDLFTGYPVGALAAGETKELKATFTARDDAEAEFSALAVGTTASGQQTGLGQARWSVEPTYLLRISTEVVQPPNDSMLPAGDPIRVTGYVKNLSNSAALDLGALYPEVSGNAGVMSLSYDNVGTDPKALVAPAALHLEPGESRNFTVRVTTGYSDPKGTGGVNRSGGTRTTLTFTPWGRAQLEDGTTVDIAPEQIETTPADLQRNVHIDDSIPIPGLGVQGYLAVGGGVMVGGVEGVYTAAAATLMGVVDLVKLPYTAIAATSAYQAKVWASFTDAEKDAFAGDTAYLIAAVLDRNATLGKKDAAELYKQVKATTLKAMIDMENDWQVGDYAQTARLYSKFGTDTIAQVAVPIALAKLAKAPQAAAALKVFQESIQARMGPILTEVAALDKVEAAAPILQLIEAGTELTPAQIAQLYGISTEELAELQRLATKYEFLLTVRSRHASSIEWIKKAGALLKPEAIKIKSVSELDAKLGYRVDDVGSLVFKKPTALIQFEQAGGDLEVVTDAFVRSKGFTPGTPEYLNAVARIGDRIAEWKKWEGTYKYWAKRGWIDVSFNYKGNAIEDTVRKGFGQERGFKLKAIGPPGQEEYVLQMLDSKTGRYVPVTGDIDPIAFTHLDGSPLSAQEHALLLDDLRANARLAAQHGESATYVKGGVDFVVEQFKPGEAGLMIAPGGAVPRAVRINGPKSRWVSAYDYNLHWDGGFVYAGGAAVPAAVLVDANRFAALGRAAYAPVPKSRATALPGRPIGSEANVGRCRFTYASSPNALPLQMGASGAIEQVKGLTVVPWGGSAACFDEGAIVDVAIMPSTVVDAAVPAGATELPVSAEPYLAGVDPYAGFAVGQEVTINPGGDTAETRTITGFGSLLFAVPLQFAHEAGEVVVVTKAAPPDAGPGVIASGLSGSPVVPGGAAAPASGALPTTGAPSGALGMGGALLVVLGAALVAGVGRVRRRRGCTGLPYDDGYDGNTDDVGVGVGAGAGMVTGRESPAAG